MNLKPHFSRFLDAVPGRLLFTAHSHHPWPNVSYDAQLLAWNDAAQLADLKWDKVFGEVIPKAQTHVARTLNLPDPKTICFAPSVHELLVRLLSTFEQKPLRVLTTDGEFHSFGRQMKRLEESGQAQVTRINIEPYESFESRFADAIACGGYDLLYFSQVFYNSGLRVQDLDALVARVPDTNTTIFVDGYHGYMAVPADLSKIAARVFYAAGGYKYAMCGEGACFMHCPPGYAERPANTGWFSTFGGLTKSQSFAQTPYPDNGQRFMGGTYDPTGLYRLNAVMDWMQREKFTVAQIHQHATEMQALFFDLVTRHDLLSGVELIPPQGNPRGNFLIFRHRAAAEWRQRLLELNVVTDCRDDRLRIGFGVYHEPADVDELARRLAEL